MQAVLDDFLVGYNQRRPVSDVYVPSASRLRAGLTRRTSGGVVPGRGSYELTGDSRMSLLGGL
jgi:hypothetical protein